jgi:hypothetical protein
MIPTKKTFIGGNGFRVIQRSSGRVKISKDFITNTIATAA